MASLSRKLILLAMLGCAATARAQYQAQVHGAGEPEALPEQRATSLVGRQELDRRQPRSAPDALRYESGVFVQQTGHGQGSAYIRGLTGQQTLLMFDGIRLNNSTYRQGPNQYFFTVDTWVLGSIEVLRGGASTPFGSDALGGVLYARPMQPPETDRPLIVLPALRMRGTTADQEKFVRAELGLASLTRGVAVRFLGGVGYRDVGRLDGPPVENPDPTTPLGRLPYVPQYARDGRTQLGTGFKELTADGRLVLDLSPRHSLTLAAYSYMQFDSPRTDQCPAPTAPLDTCLTYEQQFRHLVYGAWDGRLGPLARTVRLTVAWQQQHEKRRGDNPGGFVRQDYRDDVNTLALIVHAATREFRPRKAVGLGLRYGLDTYLDLIASAHRLTFTDTGDVIEGTAQTRSQYLDGSSYLYGGAYLDGELHLGRSVTLRAGGRASFISAFAPADAPSQSRGVDRRWYPVVGHAGVEWRPLPWLQLLANIDHSFRAPNLDDLTSRQATGPGFQIENAALSPERATTFEAGGRVRTRWLSADLWAYEMLLTDAIIKINVPPPEIPLGSFFWSYVQLVNAPALSEVRGVEGRLSLRLPLRLGLRATLAYAWGEQPALGLAPAGFTLAERVPMSRIPPLNGTVELMASPTPGLDLSCGLRWAAAQERLAPSDYADGRIPKYGTPGFAVLDLRAGYRVDRHLYFSAVFENVLDTPYRYHGSSINGAGRGLIVAVRLQ